MDREAEILQDRVEVAPFGRHLQFGEDPRTDLTTLLRPKRIVLRGRVVR